MISVAVLAMMFALSGKAPADETDHHTGGRTFASEEVETESAIVTPLQQHQWPGTFFETAFTGRRLVLFFRDDSHNRYRLYLDDPPPVIIDRPQLYYWVSNLKSGKHTVDSHLDLEDDRKIARQLISYLGGMPDEPHIEDTLPPTPATPGTESVTGNAALRPAPVAEDLPPFPLPDPATGEPLVATKLKRNASSTTLPTSQQAIPERPATVVGKMVSSRDVAVMIGDVPLTSTAYRIERSATGKTVVVLGGGDCTLALGQTYELWVERVGVRFFDGADPMFVTDLTITSCRPREMGRKQ